MEVTPRKPSPRGFTMIELVIAMVVLGIAMSGLLPLLVLQWRAMRRLEIHSGAVNQTNAQLSEHAGDTWTQPTLYVTPYLYLTTTASDKSAAWTPWARKLGASALITMDIYDGAAIATAGSISLPDAPSPAFLVSTGGSASVATVTADEAVYTPSKDDWTEASGCYRHASVSSNSNHATSAQWTFQNVPNGYYYLKATWTTSGSATLVTYTTTVNGASAQTATDIDQTVSRTNFTLVGPWLIENATTVVVYLDAQIDTGYDVIAGSMQLVPVNTVQLTSRPSCTATTAAVTVTVTAN